MPKSLQKTGSLKIRFSGSSEVFVLEAVFYLIGVLLDLEFFCSLQSIPLAKLLRGFCLFYPKFGFGCFLPLILASSIATSL